LIIKRKSQLEKVLLSYGSNQRWILEGVDTSSLPALLSTLQDKLPKDFPSDLKSNIDFLTLEYKETDFNEWKPLMSLLESNSWPKNFHLRLVDSHKPTLIPGSMKLQVNGVLVRL